MLTLPDFQGVAPWYYEWMRHPPRDPWWSWATLEGRYDRVEAAVLNLSGWFDEPYGPVGAVTNYTGLVQRPASRRLENSADPRPLDSRRGCGRAGEGRRPRFRPRRRQSTTPRRCCAGWTVHLKGIESGEQQPAVRVFVMGANRWRASDDVADRRAPRRDTLYLPPGARLRERPADCSRERRPSARRERHPVRPGAIRSPTPSTATTARTTFARCRGRRRRGGVRDPAVSPSRTR